MPSIRVLVVDDFNGWLQEVRLLLQSRPECQLIAEASDGSEAVQKAADLKPDLILLDVGLPKLNGIEAARQIRKISPSSKIIFLSQNNDPDIVRAAFDIGAAYILKAGASHELLPAVDAVLEGKQFVSSSLKGYQFTGAAPVKTPHSHEVQFYLDDALFLDTFARFIAVALKSGRAAIAVITESHRDGLVSRVQSKGVDVGAATKQGIYIQWDVSKALSTFMVNDMPDPNRFFEVASALIEAAAKAARQESSGVVICGECSPTLWAEGKADAAIRVEQLFDQVGRTFGVDILCGYALSSFQGKEDEHVFQSICAEHSAVHSQEK